MSTPREIREHASEPENAHSGVSIAPTPHRRSPTKRPALKPLESTTAQPAPEATLGRNGSTTPTAAAGPGVPAPMAAPNGLAGHGATMPMAAAALGALSSIAAGYGAGSPTPDTGRPDAPPNIAAAQQPSGPIVWDGHMDSGYPAAANATSRAGDAMGDLNAELGELLSGAGDTTTHGRAALESILAEVDASVTALGSVPDSPAGHQLLIATLDSALHRAGIVLGHGQSASSLTAARINALADRYLSESRIQPAVASGVGSGPPLARPTGTEGQWIDSAMQLLASHGYDVSHINPADIAAIIEHESGGNPHAFNGWDSNAAAGHPSKGLMQTIDSTFYAHALPGHTDIWNPVDNIVAGVRYAIDRYGSLDNVPGIVRLHEGRSYVGY